MTGDCALRAARSAHPAVSSRRESCRNGFRLPSQPASSGLPHTIAVRHRALLLDETANGLEGLVVAALLKRRNVVGAPSEPVGPVLMSKTLGPARSPLSGGCSERRSRSVQPANPVAVGLDDHRAAAEINEIELLDEPGDHICDPPHTGREPRDDFARVTVGSTSQIAEPPVERGGPPRRPS